MDSKVKERIIGAAVLVALGVWLIPWVLDGSDPPETEANPVADDHLLPAADDSAIHSETVLLEPDSAQRQDQAEAPDTTPPATPAVIAVGTSDPAGLAQQRADDDPPVTEVPPGADADADADADPEPVAAVPLAAAEPDAGAFSVQLGAFGEQANANQLARRASEFGYEARVSEIRSGGRTMHRVRVGGFATEELAEAAASSLSAHGFVTDVVSSAQ